MTKAIVDPDELRRFSNHLDGLADALRSEKSKVNGDLNNLKDVWKDAKYRQFQLNYDEISRGMDEFVRSTMTYANYLRKKAALADRYLGR
jgi:uncharacterized protein YukE